MKKLFKNKKGFTLMEMLIVVAIIVILVAVSMPVFTSKLNDAKTATDDANERAAKAVAVAEYLNPATSFPAGTKYYYDAANGTLSTSKPTPAYGKAETGVIAVTVDAGTGVVTLAWE